MEIVEGIVVRIFYTRIIYTSFNVKVLFSVLDFFLLLFFPHFIINNAFAVW